MGQINSVATEGVSTQGFNVRVNYTSSATTNRFRYRLYGWAETSGGSRVYGSSSGELSGTASVTGNLSVIFENLQSNKTYNYEVYIQYYDTGASSPAWLKTNDSSLTRTGTCTTQAASSGSSGISNVRKSVSETSVTITWDYTPDFSTTDYYEGYVTLGSSYSNPTGIASKWSSMSQGNSGTITFVVQFSGLISNTYYAFKIEMYKGSSAQSMSDIGEGHVGNFTTTGGGEEPEYYGDIDATITDLTAFAVTFSARLDDIDTSDYVSAWIYVKAGGSVAWNDYDDYVGSVEMRPESSGTVDALFTNLKITNLLPETTYSWIAYVATSPAILGGATLYYIDDVYDTGSFTTPAVSNLKWSWAESGTFDSESWNAENAQASAAQTKAAYTAVTNNGATTDFHHEVWNDIIRWLYYLAEVKGRASSSAGNYRDRAIMTTSPYTLTSTKFNSMLNLWDVAAGGFVSSLSRPTNKSTGDEVLGRYFTRITNDLNGYIDQSLNSS